MTEEQGEVIIDGLRWIVRILGFYMPFVVAIAWKVVFW